MNSQRSKRAWYFVVVIILMAIVFFVSGDKEPKASMKKISDPVKVLPQSPATEQVSLKQPSLTKDKSYSCGFEVLKRLAVRCDVQCLIDHVRKTDTDLAVTLAEIDNLSDKPKAPLKSKLGRFIRAFTDNDKESWRILQELSQEDPQNSYPSLFYASSLKSSRRDEEAKMALKEAFQKKKHVSYFTDYYLRLHQATLDSPAVFARAMLFDMNVFRLNTSILWNLKDVDDELYLQLGKLVVRPGVEGKGRDPKLFWDWQDYQFGKLIVETEDPTEGSFLPDYEDLGGAYMDHNLPGLSETDCKEQNFYREIANRRMIIHSK